jgi:hypothetical protein
VGAPPTPLPFDKNLYVFCFPQHIQRVLAGEPVWEPR